jgi:hypothetical protein
MDYLKMQYFAYSPASFTVQSPLGFAFRLAHHLSLPILGAHADSESNIETDIAITTALPIEFMETYLLWSGKFAPDSLAHALEPIEISLA